MIAGFIILRLRNILGRKTGHQDKVYSEFAEKKFGHFKKAEEAETEKQPVEFDTDGKKQFLKGAEIAYETIITSFSKGDKESLKSLLTEKMQANFSSGVVDNFAKSIFSITYFFLVSNFIELMQSSRNSFPL